MKRIALIHDWLTGERGGQQCFQLLADMLPEADLFALVCDPARIAPSLRSRRITTTWLQRLPWATTRYPHYLPLMPLAIESLDLRGYDLVVSTSHCVAKGVIPPPGARHLCYCFTPMRYVWDVSQDYFGGKGCIGNFLRAPILHYLRLWDTVTAHRVDRFIAISRFVAERIRRYYGRDASVVYPPVDTEFYTPGSAGGAVREGFACVSALVPYKRLDLAVEAMRGLPHVLRVVGEGGSLERLRAQAPPNVEFLGHLPREGVRDLLRRSRAFIFPGIEDFGIAPVEAQACGCPVVARAAGGALETVVQGTTGWHVAAATPEAFREAIVQAARVSLDPAACRAHAETFAMRRFLDAMRREVDAA